MAKFAVPNQVAKNLGGVKIAVTTPKAPVTPPAKQVTVPTSTVPPAKTTTGIQPSVGTDASAKTDIPQKGEPVVPTKYPLIALPFGYNFTDATFVPVPISQAKVPTSGVTVPTTPNGIDPSVGSAEFTALAF